MKYVAFITAIAAVVYSEPGSGNLWSGFLLPIIGLLSVIVVFEIVGTALILVMVVCFRFSDLSSDSLFFSIVVPLGIGVGLIGMVCWAWTKGYFRYAGRRGGFASLSSGGSWTSSDWGDGGSGGC